MTRTLKYRGIKIIIRDTSFLLHKNELQNKETNNLTISKRKYNFSLLTHIVTQISSVFSDTGWSHASRKWNMR